MWTGKLDLKILRIRVDVESFEPAKKNLRIQKYPDTCGRGVSLPLDADGHFGLTGSGIVSTLKLGTYLIIIPTIPSSGMTSMHSETGVS